MYHGISQALSLFWRKKTYFIGTVVLNTNLPYEIIYFMEAKLMIMCACYLRVHCGPLITMVS